MDISKISPPLSRLSPLKPVARHAYEQNPGDEWVASLGHRGGSLNLLGAAFLGLAVLGTPAAAQAAPATVQVQVVPQVKVQGESLGQIMAEQLSEDGLLMVRLHQQAQAKDMKLEYFFQRDGERLPMNEVQAARALADGVRVEFQEVSHLPGGHELRAGGFLESREDLQSFARYFSGATPQNEREEAAQKLQSKLEESGKPAFLLSPGGNPRSNHLSAFEAAKRLETHQVVSLVVPQPESLTEFSQITYTHLRDVILPAN
jgi:hypothetical protein